MSIIQNSLLKLREKAKRRKIEQSCLKLFCIRETGFRQKLFNTSLVCLLKSEFKGLKWFLPCGIIMGSSLGLFVFIFLPVFFFQYYRDYRETLMNRFLCRDTFPVFWFVFELIFFRAIGSKKVRLSAVTFHNQAGSLLL